MLSDLPYIAVAQSNSIENENQIDFDYRIGTKVVLIKDGINRKDEDKNIGLYLITEVLSSGRVRIKRGTIGKIINIRRLSPFFEQ